MVKFSFSHTRGAKIDNLAEKKLCCLDSPHCVFECERLQIISCDANPFLLLGAPMETAVAMVTACSLSLYLVCVTVQERVCVYTVYTHNMYVFDGRPQGGSDSLIPHTDAVHIKTSKADLRSGSATSGQSVALRTERRSDVFHRGWGPGTEGAGVGDMMSLRGGALVLLVYGGFILQQSQAQVTAPAPCGKTKQNKTKNTVRHGQRITSVKIHHQLVEHHCEEMLKNMHLYSDDSE